jgi:hypothetical protein
MLNYVIKYFFFAFRNYTVFVKVENDLVPWLFREISAISDVKESQKISITCSKAAKNFYRTNYISEKSQANKPNLNLAEFKLFFHS